MKKNLPNNMTQEAILDTDRVAALTVTEMRQDALLKAGALQSAIFNSANFSSIATDAKGVIQIFNVGAERMLGYAAADVMNKITPADISDPHEVIARATALSLELGTQITPGFEALVFKASRGIEDIYELTYIRKDGTRFPAVVSVTALRDGYGAIIGYLLIGTDNTARQQVEAERKKANEELQRANAKLKAWAEALNSFAIMAETDTHGRITYVNDPFCSISKYSREELLGKDHRELVNSGFHSKEFWREMWSTISRGQSWRGEIKNRAKDGTVYWVDTAIVPLLNANGGPETYLAIRFVITERKQAEELVRISSAYARSLIEASLDPLVTISPEGKITDVNEASVQATGVCREQLIAADFSDYFTEPGKARAGYQKVFSEGFVRDYPLAIRHISGRITDVLYNGSVYKDDKGKVLGVFAAARDVTERKRFELAIQDTNVKLEIAKLAAEKANLAKSDFLSRMSHELRSPLNAILGFAQLMESASPAPNASQSKSIARILQAGWYLLNLINEILDLAVIESGKVSISLEAVSVCEILSECQSMMEPEARERGIRMTFPRFEEPVFVMADRTRLKQIIINLLSNAIKYNNEGGAVVVDCTASGPECVRISVKDTGAGLPPEKLAQLFQPFNRLGQEAGRVAGTGIGLVVSKQLVELMGCILCVDSIAGVGSLFWCEMSSAEAPQLAMQNGEAEALVRTEACTDATRQTLLYVEDNPANMELVEELIARRQDLRLVTAVNGILGIEMARATQPQVILMDINLPGISGLKALRILREDPATAHIPIIAVSANAMARDFEKGLEAGFFRYLTKPIKIKELMDALNAALNLGERIAVHNA
ncbi:MAG: sensor hybrid histidine kinase [Verrucomicrobiales bacterium]|nr:sensor hybrid histidine kinase [Verrucomicrobiales bacterium]